ncbi:MAG: O-antigen ligase family protein [Salinivirgaceae bacterium]|nr:O-antigen ligase family protein [Salinivirgaceae bacterium]
MESVKKWFYWGVLLMLAIVPFYPVWSEVAVALVFISGVMAMRNIGLTSIDWRSSVLQLLMLAFFTISAISLIYSYDKLSGLENLHTYIPFAALPILMLYYRNELVDNKMRLIKVLSGGILVASALCLILALIRSFYIINGHLVFNPYISFRNQFVYTYLSVFQYTNTFAMMAVFVVAVMLWALFNRNVKRRWLVYSSIGLAILMIFLLSSRTNVYALFVVLYYSVLVFYIRYKNLLHSLLLLVAVTGLFWVFQTCNYRVMNLSQTVTSYITEEDIMLENGGIIRHPDNIEGVNIRFQMWETGLNLVRQYWATGCGIGDYKDVLRISYLLDGLEEAYHKCYDQHNQYIETIGTMGIFGLLVLIAILAYSLFMAWRERNYLLFCCLMILSLNMMLESMFNRYSGSLFFVVSLSLAALVGNDSQNKLREDKVLE